MYTRLACFSLLHLQHQPLLLFSGVIMINWIESNLEIIIKNHVFCLFFLHTASRLNMIGLLTWIKSPLNLYFCIHHTPLVNTMIVANFPCDLIFYHFFIITVIEPFKDLFFDPKSKSIDFNLSSQVIYKIKLTVWQTLFFKLFYAFIKIQKKLSLNNKHWL